MHHLWVWACAYNVHAPSSQPQTADIVLPCYTSLGCSCFFWQQLWHTSCSFLLPKSSHALCLMILPVLAKLSSCTTYIISLMTSCPVSSSSSLSVSFFSILCISSHVMCHTVTGMHLLALSCVLAWCCLISAFPKGGLSSCTVLLKFYLLKQR